MHEQGKDVSYKKTVHKHTELDVYCKFTEVMILVE